MKIWFFLLCILPVLLYPSQQIRPDDHYYVNIRQVLQNKGNTLPAIDIMLYSVLRNKAGISFRTSLTDLYPTDFILSLDSLKTGNTRHSVFIGDYYSPILGSSRICGVGYKAAFMHLSGGIIGGRSRDFFYSRFPTFYHNISQMLVYGGYSFGTRDTTQLYLISRSDDTQYNEFTHKQYIGIRHNSQIARTVHVSLDGQYADFYSDAEHYSNVNAKYSIYSSLGQLALGIRGEYVPRDFIAPNNMLFLRGRFMNMLSMGYRITDELSLYANYQIYKYLPEDDFSFDQYNIRVSTRIPVLPHISLSVYYSRYLHSNAMRDMMWRVNANKRFNALLTDIVYSHYDNNSIQRHSVDASVQYHFPNNARMGNILSFSRLNNSNAYRLSGYIGWNPLKVWNLEVGMDYTLTEYSSYMSEYAKSTFIFDHIIFSTQFNIRFQEETYMRFTANLSVRDRIRDIHLSGLSGHVFYDDNQNGLLDSNEKRISDVNVRLNDSIIASTGQNGAYAFRFMKPGTYSLGLDMGKLPAYLDVRDEVQIVLKNLHNTTFNIPLIKMSSVTGNVFEDYNRDGIKQTDEPGIGNVVVRLKDTDSYTYTDANGYYILSNLPHGNYIVEIPRMPEGYDYSIPNLINYISVKSVKQDYSIDFGLIKGSKPVRKKVF